MKNNQRVMLIAPLDRYDTNLHDLPILGTLGTVVHEIDSDDDYYVVFDNYATGEDEPFWFVHESRIIAIDLHEEVTEAKVERWLSRVNGLTVKVRRPLGYGKA